MAYIYKKFCTNGHDMDVVGRRASGHCNVCKRAKEKEWALNNPEKVRAKVTRQHAALMANDEQREAKNAQHRERHAKKAELRNMQNKAWREAHPDECAAHRHNRRARIGEDKLTGEQVRKIREEANGKCYYCPSMKATDLEHKTPLCRGGRNIPENLYMSCEKCNCAKWHRTEEEFYDWRRKNEERALKRKNKI